MAFDHPVLWILIAAVAAPLLAQIPLGLRLPTVVIEVLLGILVGPHGLDLTRFDGFIATMFTFGMGMTLFMAGMELDFGAIKGRPLQLASMGWCASLALAVAAVEILHVIPAVHAPLMVGLALCTTGLGVLIPVFRDGGQLETPFGRLMLAAGTVGELGPILAMSLLLSERYSTWQEMGFLLVFVAVVTLAVAVSLAPRPPRLIAFLGRQLQASTQLPVRISLLIMGVLYVLADEFGFESILGAFAAGMVVEQATRHGDGKPLREKLDAVSFGWFFPFFFVGTGIKFDITALGENLRTMLMLPAFVLLLLVVRGSPVLLYRRDVARALRLPFALASAVPSLSIVIVMTEIGLKAGRLSPDVAAALVGAALLSVMLFPTLAAFLLDRIPASGDSARGEAAA